MADVSTCPHGDHPSACMDCLFETPVPAAPRRTIPLPPRGSVSSTRAIELAGITYRQIDTWVREGVITPSGQVAQGSGTQHAFTPEDIRVLRACGHLARLGAKVETLARVRAWWADNTPEDGRVLVVPAAAEAIKAVDPDLCGLALADSGPAWCVPVAPVGHAQIADLAGGS